MTDLTLNEPAMWVIVLITAAVAGFIRGFTGFAGPAIMVLVLIQFYSPISVLPKIILIDLLSNLKLLPSTVREVDRKVIFIIIATSLLGLPAGMYLLVDTDPLIVKRFIAILAAVSAIIMLIGWRLSTVPARWIYATVGFLSGIIFGLTTTSLLMMVFLFSIPAAAAVSRANAIHWVFTLMVCTTVGYALTGVLTWDAVWRSLLVGVLYLVAAVAGSALFRVTPERNFRQAVLWLLVLLSGIALARSYG
ncbi:MAG: putative membrane protein YfcA [Gammaproteobacteria bacterium]|jgi:uncharacterized membrane protein YfcA